MAATKRLCCDDVEGSDEARRMWGKESSASSVAHSSRWLHLSAVKMAAEHHHVLSKQPLNAEPPPDVLVSTFLTSNRDVYHRNHGEFVELDAKSYNLIVSSEADAVRLTKSDFALAELQQDFPKRDLVTVLSCAGNRRTEMDHEKEVEGLKWGTSAIANCHFAGKHPGGIAGQMN